MHASIHRDRHTPAKRDALGRPGHPVRHRRIADGVVEARHAGERDPSVLAEPAVRAAGAGARAVPAVGSTLIRVGVRVAGEHGGGAVRVREGEDHGGDVGVGGGVVVERVSVLMGAWNGQPLVFAGVCTWVRRGTYTFCIVVGHENVGPSARYPAYNASI